MNRLILAALLLGLAAPAATAQVVINEVDSDTPTLPTNDSAEFVELYGAPNTSLTGLVLVFFNGNGDVSYLTISLTGQSTNASGFFAVGNPGVVAGATVTFPVGTLQNGQDAVAVYAAAAASFPNGTAPTTTGLVDAVVYGTADAIDTGLLAGLGQSATYQFEESYNGTPDLQSLARLNVLTGPNSYTLSGLLYVQAPTPNAANAATVTVDETAGVDNIAGWRLLGVPLVRPFSEGALSYAVDRLASINLVQGIAAGGSTPAQYPTAPGPNILTAYDGGSTSAAFLPPATTGETLDPGEGFFWYFYDQNITPTSPAPFGVGTSVSYELTNAAFALSLSGLAVDNRLFGNAPYQTQPIAVTASGAYMGANPFAYPASLSAVGVSAGTLSSNFSVYDPTLGTYTTLTSANVVAPWQGVFFQVTGIPMGTTTIRFTATSTGVVPTSNVALVGRPASAEARLSLRLDGVLASGVAVADYASAVRLLDDATTGWDRHDGIKLSPPQAEQALVAFGGGEQAILSLPLGLAEAVTAPVALRASEAGTFSLSWDATSLPAGLRASLRDLATGTVVDLRASEAYAFTADASDWAARFELVLTPDAVVATEGTPGTVSLGAAYPNPAADQARLTLRVDVAQRVTATVVDALGRTVATVFEGALAAGAEQALVVPTAQLAPGVYVVRVVGDTFQQSRRLVVAR